MKYQYGKRRKAKVYEAFWVEKWKKDHVFERSIAEREKSNAYVFYDGPPFITGLPHYGTLLSSIVKDAVPRFWTMRGKRVERRWGWDCHGLPAENFVEKQLGIRDRRDIGTKWPLETYIEKARASMVENSETWEPTIDRIGRWVDFKGAYRTMDKDFMESVWWAFKTLYEKGKIYEGEKVLMYDTRFATPVSKAEVTMDNDAYQTVTDPSAFVLFKLKDEDWYLVAWTTTPWTLPANMALALKGDLEYRVYAWRGKKIVLAAKLAEKFFNLCQEKVPKSLMSLKGEALAGKSYLPLIEESDVKDGAEKSKTKFKVWTADFVGESEGTGIVHIAPAYGEDDFKLALAQKIPVRHVIDDNGFYVPIWAAKLHELGVRDTEEGGIEVWSANKFVAKMLEASGKIVKIEYIKHEYPFNPRSKQRIMYRAIPSWFFDVESMKPLLLAKNEHINWFPKHLKHGRFAKNIMQAPDWNLSRDRFWATAMPVWKSREGTVLVIGSYAEMAAFSGQYLEDYHRPWVDELKFDAYVRYDKDGKAKEIIPKLVLLQDRLVVQKKAIEKVGLKQAVIRAASDLKQDAQIKVEHFERISKVLDGWFESGSMPFAQQHYPFENKAKFEQNYPADFIVEYVGQVRAWFYYVHVVNTALFGREAYKNVITTGTLAGSDGRKMSKSLGNYTDPNTLIDQYSADALRFLMLSSPVLSGEDFALTDKDVSDTARKLAMIWNVYDFFTMYADVDHWEYQNEDLRLLEVEKLKNPLDVFIVSRIYQLNDEVKQGMEAYNIPLALSGVLGFVDELSNWFVRRSRRRFWKNEQGDDKNEAYLTLHFVLSYLALILAPFVPFMAEELWQNMMGGESVHLKRWPKRLNIDEDVLSDMESAREIIREALAIRMRKSDQEAQIKVRQPLASLSYSGKKLPDFYEKIIAEEVNVHQVKNIANLSIEMDPKSDQVIAKRKIVLDKTLTPELKAEGKARELIRLIQAARKRAGLKVDDRISLSLSEPIAPEYKELVMEEVLAREFREGVNFAYDEIVNLDGKNITISLEKAS